MTEDVVIGQRRTGECKLMNVWSGNHYSLTILHVLYYDCFITSLWKKFKSSKYIGDRISTQKKQSAALTGVPFTQQPKRLPATGRVSSASSFRRRCDRIGQRLQFNSRSATRAEASSAWPQTGPPLRCLWAVADCPTKSAGHFTIGFSRGQLIVVLLLMPRQFLSGWGSALPNVNSHVLCPSPMNN
jgi:hypothetical protein